MPMIGRRRFDNKLGKRIEIVSLWCLLRRMNLGSTCLGSKLERRCLKQYMKVSERGCFNFTRKVPDSSVFCCASLPKEGWTGFSSSCCCFPPGFWVPGCPSKVGHDPESFWPDAFFCTTVPRCSLGQCCSTRLGADASGQGTVGDCS